MDVPHNTLTGNELHQAKIATGSSLPATNGPPAFEGALFAQIASDRTTLWCGNAGFWRAIAGTPVFGFDNPGGNETPDYKGQRYYSTSTDQEYLAVGTTSADWVVFPPGTGAGGGGSGGS